jgi:hypothetical protein
LEIEGLDSKKKIGWPLGAWKTEYFIKEADGENCLLAYRDMRERWDNDRDLLIEA